ncbi:YbaK domain protein [Natronomonas moolapensis 8.8.11]|uniref:YbaK domain protein n=1 Tax=Natronomonas moolapensis (strain DSM 18674 / CECT 7526 / JCM 14361 / 8.8.11) TaxID=268739 RepID=M1Y387_NATM8|nr:YbaK/EbsC family protein [Natronomonas moolapensis]CCQ36972.1 YbaK domain protein [Natronomonas moolapensis 8.8.11]
MYPRAKEFERRARTEHGLDVDVQEFPKGTKTAADAADAVGCSVEEIASGIVLSADGDLVVSVTSGANRVDTAKIADLLGVDGPAVSMADAEEVKATLGWSIGGVPPFCHEADVPVFLDEALAGFDRVWAAAGTPEAVFPIDPGEIVAVADADVTDIRE